MLRPFTQEFEHRQIKALLPQRLDRERENQLFVYFSQLIVYLTNKQTNSYERIITSPLLCQVWLEWLFANVSVLEWTTYRDKLSAIFQGIDLYVVAKGHNSCRHLIIQAYCAEIKSLILCRVDMKEVSNQCTSTVSKVFSLFLKLYSILFLLTMTTKAIVPLDSSDKKIVVLPQKLFCFPILL